MLFSSLSFIYMFLPLVTVLYYLQRSHIWRNGVLLLASLLFFSWGDPKFLWLMLTSTVLVWLCGLAMDKHRDNRRLCLSLMLGCIALLLGALLYFKYLNFIIDSFNSIIGGSIRARHLALPAGISFYTFQSISYVVDVYKREVGVQKNYFLLLL